MPKGKPDPTPNGKKRRRPIPPEIKQKVRERDGDTCWKCMKPISKERRRTIHHLNRDPSDHRFDLNRDNLKKNNLVQWCEHCQRKHHHCEPKPRPKRSSGAPPPIA